MKRPYIEGRELSLAELREENEQEKTVESPDGGKKFDTDKIEIGLIPWTRDALQALRGVAIPRDANIDLAVLVSSGEFGQALHLLFSTKRVTLESVIAVLNGGAKRYGYFNWKGLDPLRLYNAAMRHALHIGDADFDASHEDQATCCLLFLLHFDWKPIEKPHAESEETDE